MVLRDVTVRNTDIGIYWLLGGEEICSPGHFFGPCIRDYYLFHYVDKGTGILKIGGKEYKVSAGEVFFIPIMVSAYYEADKKDPWSYKWVGIKAHNIKKVFDIAGLSQENPVIKVKEDVSQIVKNMTDEIEKKNDIRAVSYAYDFLVHLMGEKEEARKYKSRVDLYIEKTKDYIFQNRHKKITVHDLAKYNNIDRSYLAGLFKKYTGISLQQYIIESKMNTACEYLICTDYDITQIAMSVGYDDLFVFSHTFKNCKGMSPKMYREYERKNRNYEKTT